ncbi:MAG TPA: DoxX family protein [Lichenihabitans sp.]|jgi:hypothetical protein|nr:DoxX family protein [Lichenihabitans sp.]
MEAEPALPRLRSPSRAWTWIGWTLTAIFTLFMVFDIAIKLIRLPVVEETLTGLGYRSGLGVPIGLVEAVLLILYLVRRTSLLGAVLFTALFGGTVASHVRAESPWLSHVLFGAYLALFAWGGLWLRDRRLRALFPIGR